MVADPTAYAALFYMFLAFVTGIVYFMLAVVGLSVSLSLLILIIGVPMLLLFIAMVRGVSLAEGRDRRGAAGHAHAEAAAGRRAERATSATG